MRNITTPYYLGLSLALATILFSVPVLCFQSSTISQSNPPPFQTDSHYFQQTDPSHPNHQEYDLTLLIREMAAELIVHLEDTDPRAGVLADGMVVCTFVDINKLSRTSSFGRYLAGQLMNEFQQNSFSVVDIQKNISIQVQPRRGEYGLSREPDDIAAEITAGAMLTGTYLDGKDQIMVTARILDNRTSTMLSSATVLFPKNQLIRQLLADSAAARTRPTEFVYLKKLVPY